MVLEKITLQKCLLYFESLHGRPVSPQRQHSTFTTQYSFEVLSVGRGSSYEQVFLYYDVIVISVIV